MNKKNLGSWPQVSICNQKGMLCPLFKTLVVFKLEKRRYLVGIVALVLVSVLNLIPQWLWGGSLIHHIGAINPAGPPSCPILLASCSLWDVLSALCLAYVYPWDFLPFGTDYALSLI